MAFDLELPLAKPLLQGFLRWAYTLAIIGAHPETNDWLFSNFVQLYCTTEYESSSDPSQIRMVLDFWRGTQPEWRGNNPFLASRITGYSTRSCGLQANRIKEFAQDSLHDGYYLMLFLDESKLSYSLPYRTGIRFPHHVLLHATSDNGETFGAFAYGFSQPNSSYTSLGTFRVSADELYAATLSMEQQIFAGLASEQLTIQMRYHGRDRETSFVDVRPRFDQIRSAMQSYILSAELPSLNPSRPGCYVFGGGVYEELAKYFLRSADANASKRFRQDVRHLHILEEHANLMVLRLLWAAQLFNSTEHQKPMELFARLRNKLRVHKLCILARGLAMTIEEAKSLAEAIRKIGQESVYAMECALQFLDTLALVVE